MNVRRRVAGLTLIELLVAMTIFSVLGLYLFTLMRDSLAIYRSSRGSGELYDKLDQALLPLEEDLACVYVGDPAGPGYKSRFLLTHDRPYVPPVNASGAAQKGQDRAPGDPRSFLLRFVRTFPGGELNSTVGRFAGTYGEGKAYIDGVRDLDESRAERIIAGKTPESDEQQTPALRAPGGLMEVMYFLETTAADEPGTYTLFRAVRSPVGGRDSFFSQATIEKMSPEWIDVYAQPVASGVAFFGMVCWGQNTKEWETERVLSGASLVAGRDNEFSELWWDSTRGLYSQFGLRRSKASAGNFVDDVFPSRAQFVMTFLEDGGDGAEARLIGDLPAANRNVRISNPGLFEEFEAGGPSFLRIGDEWMRVTNVSGRDLRVVRASRETLTAKHSADAPVRVGRTFKKTIEIPANRTYFRGPGEGK